MITMIRKIRCLFFGHNWKYFPNNKGRICTKCGKEQTFINNKYKTIKNDPLGAFL